LKTSEQQPLLDLYQKYRKQVFFILVGCVVVLVMLSMLRRDVVTSALGEKGYADEIFIESNHREINSLKVGRGITAAYGQSMGQLHEQRRVLQHEIGKITKQADHEQDVPSGGMVSVLLKESNIIEKVTLDEYVLGVALAEIPLDFEYEAIRAQMLVARTYIIHRLQSKQLDDVNGSEYDVTNQSTDQVYLSLDKVKQYRSDANLDIKMNKFDRALQSTEGMIIVYQEEPIDAVFFSTSNGYTENSEDYWGDPIPYLRSVKSEWDSKYSPSYKKQQTFTYAYINKQFGSSTKKPSLHIKEKTKANRIAVITINGESYSGREVRELLGLASNHFTWEFDNKNEEIIFTTYGFGHGVGLSQWGANGMAIEGYLAEDIIEHYYSGVHIQQASKLLKN